MLSRTKVMSIERSHVRATSPTNTSIRLENTVYLDVAYQCRLSPSEKGSVVEKNISC
jgi:hypothetical protein